VRWKGFTAESDTWEGRENLENAKEAVKEFEKEYWRDIEEINRQERKRHLEEENCQKGSWQENYLDGQTNGITRNTGEGWKETGKNGREKEEH